ncbi:YlxR family protein [[Mycobacterium] burgundiense]|uniref:YlxR family protein n=1 Tax=[Mycobacterium] burgundiense TaxID=3064286 RepID=A0ABM9LX89_9MYCO|nr:YlxR family protein [Mycolicibacterium sp. MU0053]CAJ1506282.1 YlxR family protein [Mycolicibacterium sp. MU0053]
MIQRENSVPIAREHRRTEGPVRTCVGCRRRELAVDLLRVVADCSGDDERQHGVAVMVDTAGNLPGRGAWLHPDPQCLQEALRRRAFVRALRITGPPDTSAVVEYFEQSEHPTISVKRQVAKNMSTP